VARVATAREAEAALRPERVLAKVGAIVPE
jgi:hypothetical protein